MTPGELGSGVESLKDKDVAMPRIIRIILVTEEAWKLLRCLP